MLGITCSSTSSQVKTEIVSEPRLKDRRLSLVAMRALIVQPDMYGFREAMGCALRPVEPGPVPGVFARALHSSARHWNLSIKTPDQPGVRSRVLQQSSDSDQRWRGYKSRSNKVGSFLALLHGISCLGIMSWHHEKLEW